MVVMTDLIERLRLPRKLEPRDDQTTVVPIEMLDEAADEIERLQTIIDAGITEYAGHKLVVLEKENERLREKVKADAITARRRIEELEAVLKLIQDYGGPFMGEVKVNILQDIAREALEDSDE